VWSALFEMYLVHAEPRNVNGGRARIDQLLGIIGRIRILFRQAGVPLNKRYIDEISETAIRARAEIFVEINRLKLLFLDAGIYEIPLAIDNDIFMEVCLMAIRNEVLSYQTFLSKKSKERKTNILSELKTLKVNYQQNFDHIADLERLLTSINDMEIRSKLENFGNFDIINNEKMTPFFLKLCKGNFAQSDIDEICDDSGSEFEDPEARNEFIYNYFAQVYRLPAGARNNFEGCIQDLGDLADHPLVTACKLTEAVSQALDAHLSIEELDRSVNECELNSAGGPDGFNNKFVKKFWPVLRIPVHKYAETCFRKRILTDSFNNANIKLIPKKGNAKNIKDWRPISLLSCFYKVISGAVNNRLKKFTDRFTSQAQKGFNKNRFIQEVLFNVLQNIWFCRNNNINGAIVSIDFAKAFDTIYHGFIHEAFRFFGVGNYLLEVMNTIGTNRTACIILNNSKVTRKFKLGTGRPLGDKVSPGQFNVGAQILMFSIELNPEIASVYQHMLVPRCLFPVPRENLNIEFREEFNAETNKADCFADDASASNLFEENNLRCLKSSLDNFAEISGLKCNFNKTAILPTSDHANNLTVRAVEEIGFKVTNTVKLLGFNITNTGIDIIAYFDEVIGKVSNIINYWNRFRLSLPGRINVFKTLLLSQLSYGGCFLMPPPRINYHRFRYFVTTLCCKGSSLVKRNYMRIRNPEA
jgi:Reverse transcriptase (RNA-dependent DNA polymerase)